jgi:FixJ family two-component response regulator
VAGEFIIAVIDDDESFRIALVGLLRSLGYEAEGFASAVEFINSGGEGSCDCIITDFKMPGMSGLDLLQLLNARYSTLAARRCRSSGSPGAQSRDWKPRPPQLGLSAC